LKVILLLVMFFQFVFSYDATIEVIKKVDTLPSIAIEDSSTSYTNRFKLKFFKVLVADLNVISLFNVDQNYRTTEYDNGDVVFENKDMKYVLRYQLIESDSGAFNLEYKLIKNNKIILAKHYKIKNSSYNIFISHAVAYDINKFMGASSVEWMKKKVIFSRVVAPKKSEIVISDYTLSYQKVIVKGGFNLFPKWATKKQNSFYYTSLDRDKPSLFYVDIKKGTNSLLLESDGMMICSDVSKDSKKLLLTMAPKGQPDIYLYNVDTKRYKKVTSYRGIDVAGKFMNNNEIIFVSNRLGYPNIFSKRLDTNEVEQMVYYGKSNSACSVNGDYIVYKARETSNLFSKNTFNLHLISRKTDFIRRLTATGVNEFPKFSRDGDAILFIKNYKSQSSIGIIRLNHNKNYLFPLKYGKVQSMDW